MRHVSSSLHLVPEAVHDRILDERLQQHGGYRRGSDAGVAMLGDGETVAEANLHDRDVLPHEVELLVEGDPMSVVTFERLPKEAAQ